MRLPRLPAVVVPVLISVGCTSWQPVRIEPTPSPRPAEELVVRGDRDVARLVGLNRARVRLRPADGAYRQAKRAFVHGDSVVVELVSGEWVTFPLTALTSFEARQRSVARTTAFTGATLVLMVLSALIVSNLESCVETATVTCGGY